MKTNNKSTENQTPKLPDVGVQRLVSFSELSQCTFSDQAEQFLKDYTCADTWEQMAGIEWTTSEVHEAMSRLLKEKSRQPSIS